MCDISSEEFSKKMLEGFRVAVKKVVDEARENKDYIVISDKDGNVLHIYPHLEDEKREREFMASIKSQIDMSW